MSLLIFVDRKAKSVHPVKMANDPLRHQVAALGRWIIDLLGLLRRGLAKSRTCSGLRCLACTIALQDLASRRSCLRTGFFGVFHGNHIIRLLNSVESLTSVSPTDHGPILQLSRRTSVNYRLCQFASRVLRVQILKIGGIR